MSRTLSPDTVNVCAAVVLAATCVGEMVISFVGQYRSCSLFDVFIKPPSKNIHCCGAGGGIPCLRFQPALIFTRTPEDYQVRPRRDDVSRLNGTGVTSHTGTILFLRDGP